MYKNLAFNRPYWQSSHSEWEEERKTNSPVNGVCSGGFAFHTEYENNPWICIDLEQAETIHQIVIWNREDDGASRACSLSIKVSIDNKNWNTLFTSYYKFKEKLSNHPLKLDLANGITARYIKIERQGEHIPHLDKVEILQKIPPLEYKELITNKTFWNSSNIQDLSNFFKQGSKKEIYPIFWEDYPFPIYLRRASSDWFNFLQIFVDQEYNLPLKPDIKMIVDLGSYIGLSAVFFANKYPLAQIICLEPSNENYELLKLNTRPYSQIRCKQAAIWNQTTKVKLHRQLGGDWGNQFFPNPEGDILALSIKDLIEEYAIEDIDFLKVDIEGGEKALFSKNYENWLPRVKAISCELHDRFVPGCSDAYLKLFRNSCYQELNSGEFIFFIKK